MICPLITRSSLGDICSLQCFELSVGYNESQQCPEDLRATNVSKILTGHTHNIDNHQDSQSGDGYWPSSIFTLTFNLTPAASNGYCNQQDIAEEVGQPTFEQQKDILRLLRWPGGDCFWGRTRPEKQVLTNGWK